MLRTSVQIRRPTAADGPAWAAFLAEAQAVTYHHLIGPGFGERRRAEASSYGDELADQFAVEDDTVRRLAVRAGEIVAVASAGPAPLAWEIDEGLLPAPTPWQLQRLYLHPDTQGTGLADALLAEVLSDDRPTYLWIIQGNDRARRFYLRHGFVELDESFSAGESWGSRPMRRMLRDR